MAIAELRKYISQMDYDPFKVNDYSQTVGIFTVTSTNTWITGLANIYRIGNVTLGIENGTVNNLFLIIFKIYNLFNFKFFLL